MKKLFFVLVMVMSVVMLNAQTTKTTPASTEKKSEKPTTTTNSTTAKPSAPAMKVADLPKVVSDNIEKAYPGYTIKEVKSEKDGAEFKVKIEKGTSKETLYYDKEGKLVKKSEAKETKKK